MSCSKIHVHGQVNLVFSSWAEAVGKTDGGSHLQPVTERHVHACLHSRANLHIGSAKMGAIIPDLACIDKERAMYFFREGGQGTGAIHRVEKRRPVFESSRGDVLAGHRTFRIAAQRVRVQVRWNSSDLEGLLAELRVAVGQGAGEPKIEYLVLQRSGREAEKFLILNAVFREFQVAAESPVKAPVQQEIRRPSSELIE